MLAMDLNPLWAWVFVCVFVSDVGGFVVLSLPGVFLCVSLSVSVFGQEAAGPLSRHVAFCRALSFVCLLNIPIWHQPHYLPGLED